MVFDGKNIRCTQTGKIKKIDKGFKLVGKITKICYVIVFTM